MEILLELSVLLKRQGWLHQSRPILSNGFSRGQGGFKRG